MGNNGKAWMIIGLVIVVIGLVFTIIMSNVTKNQIEQLVSKCEDDGGSASVTEGGILFTTSYEFKCEK